MGVKVLLAIAAVLVLAPPATGAYSDGVKRAAVLRLSTTHPVSLRGTKFLARERVKVVAHSTGQTRSRTVIAGAAGAFLVSFGDLPFDRCQGFVAVARGARGSVAQVKLPQPACPPPAVGP